MSYAYEGRVEVTKRCGHAASYKQTRSLTVGCLMALACDSGWMTGNAEVISSPVGLVRRNARVFIN
jgi:hypothetical protein